MRQVVLDTETTGLEPSAGHRIIEIGAIELIDRSRSGRHLHYFLNPERAIDEGALAVHGITNDFLADKPKFVDVADDLIQFISDCELIIHNAAFDVGFLDHELQLVRREQRIADHANILDSLELARSLHPGLRNSLDALCKRYEVDNTKRQLHGALLDAELLAEVYLRMTGGQTSLSLEIDTSRRLQQPLAAATQGAAREVIVRHANELEIAAHQARLERLQAISEHCLWLHSGADDSAPP